jgi:hypothetical protein
MIHVVQQLIIFRLQFWVHAYYGLDGVVLMLVQLMQQSKGKENNI